MTLDDVAAADSILSSDDDVPASAVSADMPPPDGGRPPVSETPLLPPSLVPTESMPPVITGLPMDDDIIDPPDAGAYGSSEDGRAAESHAAAEAASTLGARRAVRKRRAEARSRAQQAVAESAKALLAEAEAWEAAAEADSALPATAGALLALVCLAAWQPRSPGWAWWAARCAHAVPLMAWSAIVRRFGGAGLALPLGLHPELVKQGRGTGASHQSGGTTLQVPSSFLEQARANAACIGVLGSPAMTATAVVRASIAACGATRQGCRTALACRHWDDPRAAATICALAELTIVAGTGRLRGVVPPGGHEEARDTLLAATQACIVDDCLASTPELGSWIARCRAALALR